MIVAVIPLKSLATAKSRLAGVLSDDERRQLVIEMLERVVSAVRESGLVEQIALVTPERWLAERLGLVHLADRGDLNVSLQEGVQWALGVGAEQLLILPADLALINARDVIALWDTACEQADVTIARTVDGGTGALLLRPPDVLSPSFGPDSFQVHLDLSAEKGLSIWTVTREGLAVDVDEREDLVNVEKEKIACRVP